MERPIVSMEMISPVLAEWWFSKTIIDREAILYDRYMKEKLGEV